MMILCVTCFLMGGGVITQLNYLGVISMYFSVFLKAKVHDGNIFGGCQN